MVRLSYTERSARLAKNAKARRAATKRARLERQNGGKAGALFARACAFLFTAGV